MNLDQAPPQIRYPLSCSSWDEAEYDALQEVIANGQFTMAGRTAAYEQRFAEYLGVPYCVAVNSGSTANLLMVAALMYRKNGALAPGDEVVVPAVSWPTTYYPLSQYGLKLKFVDIDLETLNYDLDALEAAMTDRTRLVMVVNLLGNPNRFDRVRELCEQRGAIFVEDNCESLGATFEGRQCGTHGVMGTFSSYFSHHICTMEGGMVCTSDEELYHILLSLRAHGWTRNLPHENHVTGTKSEDDFEELFRFVLPGYNVRPIELSSATGISQIDKLPRFVADRRENASAFLDMMAGHPELIVQREVGESSWFGFSMVVRPGTPLARRHLVRAFGEAGIECRPIVAGNFADNPVMRWIDHDIHGKLANADLIDSNGLFVGNREGDLSTELGLLDEAISRAKDEARDEG